MCFPVSLPLPSLPHATVDRVKWGSKSKREIFADSCLLPIVHSNMHKSVFFSPWLIDWAWSFCPALKKKNYYFLMSVWLASWAWARPTAYMAPALPPSYLSIELFWERKKKKKEKRAIFFESLSFLSLSFSSTYIPFFSFQRCFTLLLLLYCPLVHPPHQDTLLCDVKSNPARSLFLNGIITMSMANTSQSNGGSRLSWQDQLRGMAPLLTMLQPSKNFITDCFLSSLRKKDYCIRAKLQPPVFNIVSDRRGSVSQSHLPLFLFLFFSFLFFVSFCYVCVCVSRPFRVWSMHKREKFSLHRLFFFPLLFFFSFFLSLLYRLTPGCTKRQLCSLCFFSYRRSHGMVQHCHCSRTGYRSSILVWWPVYQQCQRRCRRGCSHAFESAVSISHYLLSGPASSSA